ncbi:hypothetical protein [Burkholderia vietnamiensis]|uniref:hypothetical protein n=1 Tax=Burkholderia vietnamiensis TaxID=60552 RepID=UPI0015945D60|nr:hypothetical protein [Burkholderia vietnamiensis]
MEAKTTKEIDARIVHAAQITAESLGGIERVFQFFLGRGLLDSDDLDDIPSDESAVALFEKMLCDESLCADALEQETFERAAPYGDTPDERVRETVGDLVCIATAYCAEATKAARNGDGDAALDAAIKCVRLSGVLNGFMLGAIAATDNGGDEIERVRAFARSGADARHAENRAMREQVFEWCAQRLNEYPSLDAAAEAAQSVVPVKFRTARAWVGQYAKRLRSAGTV